MRTALSWSDSSYFVVCSLRFLVAAPFAMTTINQSDLSRDAKHLLKDYAPVVLTYLGIVATFGVASFICCLIWLLVW